MRFFPRLLLLAGLSVPAVLSAQQPSETPATMPPAASPSAAPAAAARPEPAYRTDPRFVKLMTELKDPHLSNFERIGKWKKANKVANGACTECLRNVVTLDIKLHEFKDAAAAATQLDAVATTPSDKFFAAAERGGALLNAAGAKPKPQQLEQAEASLHAALQLHPNGRFALYNEGRVLALMGRDNDARDMYRRYLQVAPPHDPYMMRVQHFVDNPHLAAMPMAPAFTIRTEQGEEFSLDNMQGRVVLLDFWASWCGPCRQTLPEIKHVVTKFAGQPLVVVSISIDRDEAAWRKAMQQEGMSGWPQYRDADGALSAIYEARSIPRFFTIDSDGVLQSVQVGSDADIEGQLKKLIAHANDNERKQALASDKPSGQ